MNITLVPEQTVSTDELTKPTVGKANTVMAAVSDNAEPQLDEVVITRYHSFAFGLMFNVSVVIPVLFHCIVTVSNCCHSMLPLVYPLATSITEPPIQTVFEEVTIEPPAGNGFTVMVAVSDIEVKQASASETLYMVVADGEVVRLSTPVEIPVQVLLATS